MGRKYFPDEASRHPLAACVVGLREGHHNGEAETCKCYCLINNFILKRFIAADWGFCQLTVSATDLIVMESMNP